MSSEEAHGSSYRPDNYHARPVPDKADFPVEWDY